MASKSGDLAALKLLGSAGGDVLHNRGYFSDSDHVASYRSTRPTYPQEIYDIISGYLKAGISPGAGGLFPLAVDVGCGTGHQSTYPLLEYFRRVVGCDVSAVAIETAIKDNCDPRLVFKHSPAENLPVEDNSASLVVAATALHYFDCLRFYAEVDRALVPGGVVACMCYNLCDSQIVGHPNSDDIVRVMNERFTRLVERGFADTPQRIILHNYTAASIQIPYSDKLRYDNLTIEMTSTVQDLLSGTKNFLYIRKMFVAEPDISELWWEDWKDRLMRAVGTDDWSVEITIRSKVILLLGRKPA